MLPGSDDDDVDSSSSAFASTPLPSELELFFFLRAIAPLRFLDACSAEECGMAEYRHVVGA